MADREVISLLKCSYILLPSLFSTIATSCHEAPLSPENSNNTVLPSPQEIQLIVRSPPQLLIISSAHGSVTRRSVDARIKNVRETAAILANSELFIGIEGGLMHLAQSVGTNSVIIFGGYITPEISGYDINTNIYSNVDCSPCYTSEKKHSLCESMKCMKGISVEYVYNQIMEKLKGE